MRRGRCHVLGRVRCVRLHGLKFGSAHYVNKAFVPCVHACTFRQHAACERQLPVSALSMTAHCGLLRTSPGRYIRLPCLQGAIQGWLGEQPLAVQGMEKHLVAAAQNTFVSEHGHGVEYKHPAQIKNGAVLVLLHIAAATGIPKTHVRSADVQFMGEWAVGFKGKRALGCLHLHHSLLWNFACFAFTVASLDVRHFGGPCFPRCITT